MTRTATPRAGGVWNVPNTLTLLRLVLVPVFLVLLADGGTPQRWWALVVFVVASATDQLDGAIARARGQVTPLGILLDPIADKALTLGAFVMLSVLGEVAWWITLVIAVRELGITALRAALVRRSIIPASMGGKVKTVLQMLAIVLLLVPWQSFTSVGEAMHAVGIGVLLVAVAVTLATGVDYVVRGWRLWRRPSDQARPASTAE